MTGYSRKPLEKKLGLKDGMRVALIDLPENVAEIIAESDISLVEEGGIPPDFVHLFQTQRGLLEARLKFYRHAIAQNGMIWVSWPKKASKVQTDITEDVIRELCLPMGLVDSKVCAIDPIWSELKLVIRKELRTQ